MTGRERWWAAIVWAGVIAAIAGAGGLLLTRHGTAGLRPAAAAQAAVFPAPTGPIVAAAPSAAPAVAAPATLTIPEIGVRTRLVTLGLSGRGIVQVPPTASVAGWYTHSPRPGAVGPAVILGHIDSARGPGVFFRLAGLRPGDPIYVRRADGSTVEFWVTAVQSYRKDRFPTEAVYGPTPDPELRLITCGGTFDWTTGHYLSNTVVYATEAA
ncbi:MAG TPA: class F sortase [Trebonia sp.]|jgi:hypothetical protein|nr:class F sortase [Trebonia sp.]